MPGAIPGPDGQPRCSWCIVTPEYVRYHDTEWGFPVTDDQRLFEKICLEGFQSGLSWRTILTKREDFRRVFHGFDYDRIAKFAKKDVERLETVSRALCDTDPDAAAPLLEAMDLTTDEGLRDTALTFQICALDAT